MSSKQLNDGTIIDRVRGGETELFSELVNRYRGPLFRLALSRLGRIEWAEDAVQETFLCAYKSLHSYNSAYSFRTWLWTILLNQCRRHLRRIQRWSGPEPALHRQSDTVDLFHELEGREQSPEQQAIAVERLKRIESAMTALSPAQADAVRLRFFGHLKFQEIADALHCSLSTAKSRVRIGLQMMSEQLEPQSNQASSNDSH